VAAASQPGAAHAPGGAGALPLRGRLTFNWLSSSGTACFLAALLGAAAAGLKPRQFAGVVGRTARRLALAELTLAAVLGWPF